MASIPQSVGAVLRPDDLHRLVSVLDEHALVSITDAAGSILYANEKFCRVSGYALTELIGANHRLVRSDHHPPAFYETLWETISRGEIWQGEIKNRARDGSHYWVETTIMPFLGGDGLPYRYVSIRTEVTALKAAERTVRLQAEALDYAPSGIAIADARLPDAPLIYVNPAFCRMTGYQPGEMLGRNCRFLQGDDRDQPGVAAIREAVRRGESASVQLRNYRKDGSLFHNAFSVSPVHDLHGELTHFIGVSVDVSERVAFEEALRRSEDHFRRGQRAGGIGTWDWDLRSNTIFGSEGAAAICGLPREDIELASFETFSGMVHADDREAVRAAVWASIEGGTPYAFEYRLRWPDGSIRWVLASGDTERDASGRAVKMSGVIQDITARKQAELQMQRSERKYRTLLEGASDAIVMADAAGRVVSCNLQAEALFGYSRERLGELRLPQLHPDHEAPLVQAALERVVREGRIQHELHVLRADGQQAEVEVKASLVDDEEGPLIIGIYRDITARKQRERQWLDYLVNYDGVTALPNRDRFLQRLDQGVRERREDQRLLLIFLNLDRFRPINERLGHGVGDLLLAQVAERLSGSLRAEEFLARTGPDEFGLILPDGPPPDHDVADRFLSLFAEPFQVAGRELFVTASVGLAAVPDHADSAAELMRRTDLALTHAKGRGGNSLCVFDPDADQDLQERMALETDLRRAVRRGELFAVYQPQYDAYDGHLVGAEALVRWRHPSRGLLSPAVFIPLAEELQLIGEIGEWMLFEAARQALVWREAGLDCPVAVNISAQQLQRGDLVDTVRRVLAETGLPPRLLALELTESMLVDNVADTQRLLAELAGLGLELAIDDFGTGYSSLAYLKRFAIHKLKIDRSFVKDAPADPNDAAIAKAVIAMARALQLRVIAEGVETEAQLKFLRSHGCHEVQGFLLSKPVDPEALPGTAGNALRYC